MPRREIPWEKQTPRERTNPLPLTTYLKPQIDRGEIVEDDEGWLMGRGPNGDARMYFVNYLDQIGYATEEGGELHSVFIFPPREGWRRVMEGID